MPLGRRSAAGVLIAFLAVAIAAWWWVEDPSQIGFIRQQDQNVLLVTIDTLRADALGCYGGAATPAIDALASRGVRYDFAHAHAVVTLPSHASILTGLYPFQHGIRDNSGFRLDPATPTVATAMKKAGFATAAFVGAFPLDARFGLSSGFDVYDDSYADAGRSVEFAIPERKAEEVVGAARAWISTQRGRWFTWIHVFDPHAPYEPPSPFDKEFASNPYWGEVAYTDRALSPLLRDLDAQPRGTIVIVTADHGEAMGDHNEVTHGLFAYEATLRVPLIVSQLGGGAAKSAPAAAGRGEVSTLAARHVDLAPTILDLVRVDAPSGLAGRSLVGPDGRAVRPDRDDERTSYFEAMSASLNRGWAPLSGVLAGREKLIALPLPELYDLHTDPREATNLIDTRGERRRALEARLNAFGASNSPLRRLDESPDALARLRALGYVSGSAPRKDRYTEADDPKRLIDLDRMIHEGVELYQRGLPSQAEQVYASLLQRRPDMALAYKHLAALQWETGRPADAVQTLERALQAGAADVGMRAQLGIYLAESGDPGKAIPLLEIPDMSDPDALNALGIAYARGGRLGDALRTFEKVLSADPGNTMALENIGSTRLSMRDTAGARAALLRASELNPRSARAQVGLGAVEMAAGNRDAAFAHWRRAVELDPSDLEALYNLATGLAAAGRRGEARPYAEAFIRQAPPARFAREIAELGPLTR
jgi:arylsulfatase A-like enzyme/Flp pilus assembly protein TadD